MKKLSWFKCLTSLFLSLALIIGGFVLNSYKKGVEDAAKAEKLQTAVYVMLGIGAVLLVLTGIVMLIKAAKTKVTEYAMHCMRFAIIIIAVSISSFMLLSGDFGRQETVTRENELIQVSRAASVRLSEAIGEDSGTFEENFQPVSDAVFSLFDSADEKDALFLYSDNITNGVCDIPAESVSACVCGDITVNADSVKRAQAACADDTLTLSYTEDDEHEYRIVTVPVYNTDGRCVGALEISENLTAKSAIDLINFPLIITIAGAVILLIILYCVLMNLIEVLLRPRIGEDPSGLGANAAFRLGNESARSISLLMSMCVTLPILPVIFDFSEPSKAFFAEKASWMPEVIAPFVPLLAYMLTCILGNRLASFPRNRLLAPVITAGGILSIAGIVGVMKFEDFLYKLISIAVWGLGCGIAGRMCDKYRVYARYSFNGDTSAIYSPYLGLASGVLLGGFLYVGGAHTLMIFAAVITGVLSVLALFLYRNADCSHIDRSGDEDFLNEVYSSRGGLGRFGLLAVVFSVVLTFTWFALTVYLIGLGIAPTAIAFGAACVILGGGVLGNLYRKAETPILRFMFALSGLLLAASLVPFAIAPGATTAIACYFLVSIAEILGHGTINAYLTQDKIDAGSDGIIGTDDDVRTFTSKDRIGYWGQGSLLLEITSLLSVVGGIYVLQLDSMMMPLLIAALIVAIVAVFNMVLIVTAKPATKALAVVSDDAPKYEAYEPAPAPKPKKEKSPRERRHPEKKAEKPKDEAPAPEEKPEEKPVEKPEEKADEPVFDFGLSSNDFSAPVSEPVDLDDKKDDDSVIFAAPAFVDDTPYPETMDDTPYPPEMN